MNDIRCLLKISLFYYKKHFWRAGHDFDNIYLIYGKFVRKNRENTWGFLHEWVNIDVDFSEICFF